MSGVSKHANVSSIDVLGPLLVETGYKMTYTDIDNEHIKSKSM